MRLSILAAALAAAMPLAAAAAPVTIDFDSLSSGSFTSGSEDGFDLTATGGFIVGLAGSVPGFSADNYFTSSSGSPTTTLTIKETDGSAFSFSAFNYVFNGTPGTSGTVTIRGFQNSGVVVSDTLSGAVAGNSAISFPASNLANVALTKLTIEFTTVSGWSPFIDNIALDADATLTPIPLPGAAWLLLGGLGALGAVARKRAA